MALSYEFSIGSVRAKENSLFSQSDIENMLVCKSTDELCRFLNDKGYGDGKTVEEVLSNHTMEMWNYLKSVAPDYDIFAPFLYQNDIHNLKAVLKGTMSGRDYKNLLISPCTVSIDSLINAVENRKFNLLPDWLASYADKAYEIIAHTGDARMSDAVLDKAVMREMLKSAKKTGSEFVEEYFNTIVFYNNVKISIRSARTGTDSVYLKQALCDVDGFNKTAIINSALKGGDSLIDTLAKYSDYDCNKAIDAYKKSPSAFEKFVDDRLITKAKEFCKRSSEGAEPLMGYMIGCEAEKKVIHIIACGIRTNSDTDKIRERLRVLYG